MIRKISHWIDRDHYLNDVIPEGARVLRLGPGFESLEVDFEESRREAKGFYDVILLGRLNPSQLKMGWLQKLLAHAHAGTEVFLLIDDEDLAAKAFWREAEDAGLLSHKDLVNGVARACLT